MEAQRKRNIRSGEEYSHLFPKAENSVSTIRRNANVTHTVAFIPKVVDETLDHTKQIAQILKGNTTYETCSNIWHFVYRHIAYKKDQEGYEQIRSPARAWHDRKRGVDCDCYSVFISSILCNLQIPHILRITKYHRDYFQHIYPVVPLNGKEIPIDCVTDQFNYQVPYSEKKDYHMDLQYLNGFDGYSFGQLGKIKKGAAKASAPAKKKISLFSKAKIKKAPKAAAPAAGQPKQKKKGVLKKVVNKVNKINPATVLLRNGVLAAMKLNVKNIAKRLRWTYLTPEQAAQKDIDPAKFQRLIATRQKLERIFYGAGGKEENLKKAILGGKGNADKAISGLNGVSLAGMEFVSAYTPLPQLLGPDVYYSENVEGFEGLGQLGEPITLASVSAAMGVLAGIIAALKQIGDIFLKKTKGSEDFDEKTNEAAENNLPVPGTTPVPDAENATPAAPIMPAQPTVEESFKQGSQAPVDSSTALVKSTEDYPPSTKPVVPASETAEAYVDEPSADLPVATSQASTSEAGIAVKSNTSNTPTKETYWDKNKNWLKPVAIGIGGISLIAIAYAVMKPKQTSVSAQGSLSGLSKKNKQKQKKARHKSKPKSKPTKKTAVALL
jgi:hypothetical protein